MVKHGCQSGHLPEAAKASRELLKCGCKAKPLCSRKCNVMMQGSLVQPCVNVVDCVNLDSEFPIFLFLFLRVLIFADIFVLI